MIQKQKFKLPISQAAYIYNVFLLPKLELALHYVHGNGTQDWVKKCDGAIKHAVDSPIRLSHPAVALLLGFRLPSWMEIGIKISELFLRANSKDDRWGLSLRDDSQYQTCVDESTVSNRWGNLNSSTSTFSKRALYLAVHRLGWKLHLFDTSNRLGLSAHLFDQPPICPNVMITPMASLDQCTASGSLTLLHHKQPKVTCSPGLTELPLRECEYHMALVRKSDDKLVIDDIRRSALKQLYNTSMTHWHDRHQVHQGRFAHEGILHLSRISLDQVHLVPYKPLSFMSLPTIHQHWQVDPSAKSGQSVQALRCAPCRDDMSIDRLSVSVLNMLHLNFVNN